MLDFIRDTKQISEIFADAIAPMFFLVAAAAFSSLMTSRQSTAIERIRMLNAIADEDHGRVRLRKDLDRLRRRVHLLNSGILAALHGGICITLLVAIMFIAGFAGLRHAYGAGSLFIMATAFLGFALIRFAQEVRIGLATHDEFE